MKNIKKLFFLSVFSILSFASCDSDELTDSFSQFDNYTVISTDVLGDGILISGYGLTYYVNDNELSFKLLLNEDKSVVDSNHILTFSLSKGEGTINGKPVLQPISLNEGSNDMVLNITTAPNEIFLLTLEIKNEFGVKKIITIPVTTVND